MITRNSTQHILFLLRKIAGLNNDPRTLEQLEEHYQIEKELANKLRKASREERDILYASLYDELFQRVPSHQQLTSESSSHAKTVAHRLKFLHRFLHKNSVFLEVGAGDCAVAFAIARLVKKVYAVEVSEETQKSLIYPQNFELILFNGFDFPLPENCINVAYSDQVMEHIHPDDALEQLQNIYKLLTSGGIYICVTPNRLSGPHDISKYFDVVASGFHLKEYTNTELSRLFKQVGFSKFKVYLGVIGFYIRCPLIIIKFVEYIISKLPYPLSKLTAQLLLLYNIRIVGTK